MAEALIVIKNDQGKLKVRNLERMRTEKLIFLLPTWQVDVGRQIVSFWESTARSDKVKTSVENEPWRCKEKKVYEF